MPGHLSADCQASTFNLPSPLHMACRLLPSCRPTGSRVRVTGQYLPRCPPQPPSLMADFLSLPGPDCQRPAIVRSAGLHRLLLYSRSGLGLAAGHCGGHTTVPQPHGPRARLVFFSSPGHDGRSPALVRLAPLCRRLCPSHKKEHSLGQN